MAKRTQSARKKQLASSINRKQEHSGAGTQAQTPPELSLTTADAGIALSARTEKGMSPNDDLHTKIERMMEQQRQVLEKFDAPRRKDIWDRMGPAGTLIVGLIGIVFTFLYQINESRQRELLQVNDLRQRQISQSESARLQELQIVAAFLPFLAGADEKKRALAVRAMSALGSPRSAAILAGLYPSPGTESGLKSVLRSPNISSSDRAAIDTVLRRLPKEFVRIAETTASSSTTATSPDRVDSLNSAGSLSDDAPCGLYRDVFGQTFCDGPCLPGQMCGRRSDSSARQNKTP